jgi:hypothetical protein
LARLLWEPAGKDIDPVTTEDDDLVAFNKHAIDRPAQSCSDRKPKIFEPAAVKMNHIRHAAISCERRNDDLPIGTALQGETDVQSVHLSLSRGAPKANERKSEHERRKNDVAIAAGDQPLDDDIHFRRGRHHVDQHVVHAINASAAA